MHPFRLFLRCTPGTHLSSAWCNQFPNRIMPLPEARVLRKIAWWLFRQRKWAVESGASGVSWNIPATEAVSKVGGAPAPGPAEARALARAPPSTSFTAFGILCASTSASRQVHCVPNSLRVSGDKSSRWVASWVWEFGGCCIVECGATVMLWHYASARGRCAPIPIRLLYGILLPVSSHLRIVHTAIFPLECKWKCQVLDSSDRRLFGDGLCCAHKIVAERHIVAQLFNWKWSLWLFDKFNFTRHLSWSRNCRRSLIEGNYRWYFVSVLLPSKTYIHHRKTYDIYT